MGDKYCANVIPCYVKSTSCGLHETNSTSGQPVPSSLPLVFHTHIYGRIVLKVDKLFCLICTCVHCVYVHVDVYIHAYFYVCMVTFKLMHGYLVGMPPFLKATCTCRCAFPARCFRWL